MISLTEYLKIACKHYISISRPDHGSIQIDPLVPPRRVLETLHLPTAPLMQCPVSAHLHLFVGVHNRTACYKTRQRDCIMVPLLKLCNLLSNTFDLLMKSKVAWCEHVYAPMHVNILVLKCYIYYIWSTVETSRHNFWFHISVLTCFWAVILNI